MITSRASINYVVGNPRPASGSNTYREPRLERGNNSKHGGRSQFNGGRLLRRLAARSHALRCSVARRKLGKRAKTLAGDQRDALPDNKV